MKLMIFIQSHYCELIEQNQFRINDIMILFGDNYHNAYEIITKLIEKGYLSKIKREGFTQNYYAFKDHGLKKLKEFEKEFKHILPKIHEELKNLDTNKLSLENRMENDDILIIYPKIILEIIKSKGYNEFTIKELADCIGKTTGNVSKILRKKLIPNGIVKIETSPTFTKIRTTTIVYSLIDAVLD